jgi:hypothetical protein
MMHVSLIRVQDMIVAGATVGALFYLKPGAFTEGNADIGKAFLLIWGTSLFTHVALNKLGLSHIIGA